MISGGSGARRSRGSLDASPNPANRTGLSTQFTKILAGLMSLWTNPLECAFDRAAAAPIAKHRNVPTSIGSPISFERLATRILKKEQGPTLSTHKIERPDRPGRVKLILQIVFVSEAVEDSRRGLLRDRHDDQNRPKAAASVTTPPAAECMLGVLPQDLEIRYFASASC